MKKYIRHILLMGIVVYCFLISICFAKDPAALKNSLTYLNDIPEISWVEIDNNNVFIGFLE